MPHATHRRILWLSLGLCALVAAPALAQGKGKDKGPKPAGGEEEKKEGPVKTNVAPPPKSVDEAIAKNMDKMKKESAQISEKIGSEVAGAQGLAIALRAEEPLERVVQLVKLGEGMLFELSNDFGLDPVKDLWAGKLGPFQMFCFKSKASFGDAYREFLEKRFPSHGLGNDATRKRHLDIGRFISHEPSPLVAGEVDNHEYAIAHWVSQEFVHILTRRGLPPLVASAPATAGDGAEGEPKKPGGAHVADKAEIEQMKAEDGSWLHEGFALYGSVRFVGANRMYCVSDTRYVGKTGIADKDLDTSYRLVCLEMAQGEEDKAKDFATLVKTENNALNYLDLAKSWSFFDWMMRTENRPKLLALLSGMRSGSFQGSVQRSLGWSLSDLESNWKKFVLAEYGGKKKPAAPDPKGKKADPKDPKKKGS